MTDAVKIRNVKVYGGTDDDKVIVKQACEFGYKDGFSDAIDEIEKEIDNLHSIIDEELEHIKQKIAEMRKK